MTTLEAAQLDPSDECPHEPSKEPLWQESVVLLFQDPTQGVGGVIRIGHHPNLGTSECTFGIVTPGPWYTRSKKDLQMRAGDRSGSGYAADGFVRAEFDGALSRWEAHDDLCDLDLEVTNSQPLYDTWQLVELDGGFRDKFAPRHTETAGTVRGDLRIGDTRWRIDGFAYRDHSWGLRDHGDPDAALSNFFWLTGSFGPDFIFGISEIVTQSGIRSSFGYVLKDGILDNPRVSDALFVVELDGITMRSARFRLETPRLGEFDFELTGLGNVLLALGDQYIESAMPSVITCGGRSGGAQVAAMFNARAGSASPSWLFGAATANGLFRPARFDSAGRE